MTRIDAKKLLGGYATGTLTEPERRDLLAAAMGHQAIFDALMDEEALRELLADPVAKAQLLAALVPAAAPKVLPFWRRTGVLGAAASLLLASLAGLAYLRSPDKASPSLHPEVEKAPAAKVVAVPLPAQVPPPIARTRIPAEKAKGVAAPLQVEAKPASPPPEPIPQRVVTSAAGASVAAVADASREKAAEFRRAEAQDNLARKAEAPRPAAAAVMEVVASVPPASVAKKAKAQGQTRQDVPSAVSGGMVSGMVGGVISGPPATPAQAQRVEWKAAAAFAPSWTLEPRPDGSTQVLVKGPAGAHAVLLRRSASGVAVLALKVIDPGGEMTRWAAETRLAVGDALDLYLLNAPVAEPVRLPETGPVDGFRARIFPAVK